MFLRAKNFEIEMAAPVEPSIDPMTEQMPYD